MREHLQKHFWYVPVDARRAIKAHKIMTWTYTCKHTTETRVRRRAAAKIKGKRERKKHTQQKNEMNVENKRKKYTYGNCRKWSINFVTLISVDVVLLTARAVLVLVVAVDDDDYYVVIVIVIVIVFSSLYSFSLPSSHIYYTYSIQTYIHTHTVQLDYITRWCANISKKRSLNVNKQQIGICRLPLLAHCHYYIKLKCECRTIKMELRFVGCDKNHGEDSKW